VASFNERSLLRGLLLTLVASAALSFTPPAQAAPCSALARRVVVTGGGKVIIEALAKSLSATGISVIYKLQGSCKAVDAILNGAPLASGSGGMPDGGMSDGGTVDNSAIYWNGTTEQTCELDPGTLADIGISDVFASTCQSLPNGLPNDVGDFFGPVEAYAFVVPKKSTQKAISKAAAYFVYGFGSESGVEPWTDANFIFQRDVNSGTQQMMSVAIGVPVEKWRGTPATSSGDLATRLAGVADAEKAIGIVTAEVAGDEKARLNVLAFKDTGQNCAYWPDSNSSSSDKKNVRDGHYPIWGPLHLLTKINPSGYALNDVAKELIAYMTGTLVPPNGFDLITLLSEVNIVPACAMRVTRTSELGPLASFAPEVSCGCYFDRVSTGVTTCTPCKMNSECPDPSMSCNYGYCEAQ
jgi:hypothetical protein